MRDIILINNGFIFFSNTKFCEAQTKGGAFIDQYCVFLAHPLQESFKGITQFWLKWASVDGAKGDFRPYPVFLLACT